MPSRDDGKNPPRSAMIRAANLWEKTSAKGETYLVGRLGGLRVLVSEREEETAL